MPGPTDLELRPLGNIWWTRSSAKALERTKKAERRRKPISSGYPSLLSTSLISKPKDIVRTFVPDHPSLKAAS